MLLRFGELGPRRAFVLLALMLLLESAFLRLTASLLLAVTVAIAPAAPAAPTSAFASLPGLSVPLCAALLGPGLRILRN